MEKAANDVAMGPQCVINWGRGCASRQGLAGEGDTMEPGEGRHRGVVCSQESGLVYWTMGAPVSETTIINRCRVEDSYDYRLAHGTLPD